MEKDIWRRFKGNGLEVISIGALEKEEQRASWAADHKLTHTVIADINGAIYKKYGGGSVPYHVLIDRSFKVRLSQEEFDQKILLGEIEDSLSDRRPT